MNVIEILKIAEIVLSVVIIILVVLQPKDSDAGTLFGGGFGEEVKRTKRGAELALHNVTIVAAIFWVAIAISIMLIGG